MRFQCSLSASFVTFTCVYTGRIDEKLSVWYVERTSRAWDAYETRLRWPRFRLKKRGHRSIDPVAHLLVHDVVEEDVVVVGVLVLLGQLGLRVHEVRGRAAVRFLARIRSLALARSLHAAHGGVRTQIARAMFFFKRYALGHASTRERGLHRSVRKRSRGFLHDASLKLGLSRATRGLVPHRRVPEWVSLSVRWRRPSTKKCSDTSQM